MVLSGVSQAERFESLPKDLLVVEGGLAIAGRTEVPGTKHSMVLAFAAAVALGAEITIDNIPRTIEFDVLSDIVQVLGGAVAACGNRTYKIDGAVHSGEFPSALTEKIHGSIYLLAAVFAQRGAVTFGRSGGDSLGTYEFGLTRPIQQVLDVLALFGAVWEWRDGLLVIRRREVRHATIDILAWSEEPDRPAGPRVSSATKMALIMAASTRGTSIIVNPHDKEPQHELIDILRKFGVDVEIGDRRWTVHGGVRGGTAYHRLSPDPVEILTWQAIAVLTGSTVDLECGDTTPLIPALYREFDFLNVLGIKPEIGSDCVRVTPAPGPYPGARLIGESTGISTDNVPLLALVLLNAIGVSTVEDRVWTGRFGYAAGLQSLGADVRVTGRELVIGPSILRASASPLCGADTRSAAVCLVAALAAPGRTTVRGIEHLARGYEFLPQRLSALGARVDITRAE